MQKRSKDLPRMDRRLLDRPGWMTPEEVEQELSSLPDVSDKIDTREDDPAGDPEPAPPNSAAPASPPPSESAPARSPADADAGSSGGFGGAGDPPSSL